MACKSPNCKKCKWNVKMPCRVHELVDGDSSVRRVCWCDTCQAYICMECWDNIPKRGLAGFGALIEKGVAAVKITASNVKQELQKVADKTFRRKKKKKADDDEPFTDEVFNMNSEDGPEQSTS